MSRAVFPWAQRNLPLRTKLVLSTLTLLTVVCAGIGIFSHVVMSNYLTGELDGGLTPAAGRAGFPGGPPPEEEEEPDGERPPDYGSDTDGVLNAAGQRPGTLNALFIAGAPQKSALVQDDGSTEPLTDADLAILAGINPAAGPEEVTLSTGNYRIDAVELPEAIAPADSVLVTGLSTSERDRTLASLDLTIAGLSAAGLLAAAFAGTWIIRRSLYPLEELSAAATSVSQLPLASGEVDVPVRVPPSAAQPGSEVGTVGIALNEMIDHVTEALRARQASEMKVRQFVADASHELRTPLTSIRGYTELVLLSEQVSAAGRSALERVGSESRRMSALVEDLLLLARLDEGQRGEPADVDLTDMVVEITRDAQVAAPDDEWTLALPEEPVTVQAVESELRQVLINLLSNAHRHTPPGTRVEVALGAGNGRATVTVTDNGPGIDPGFIGSIFSRFSKADSARTAGSGAASSGLGLAIVQALVTANGGSIGVESEPGRTEFTVVLPLPESDGAEPGAGQG